VLKQAVDDLQADQSGDLQQWADKTLGGHVVRIPSGKIVWQPAIDVDPGAKKGALAKYIREEAAAAHAAEVEALQQQKIDQAKAAQAAFEAKAADIKARPAHTSQAIKAQKEAYANAMAEAAKYGAEVDRLTGKMRGLQATNKGIVIKARVSDLQAQLNKVEGQIKKLTDKPHKTAVELTREGELRQKAQRIRKEMQSLTSKNWLVIVRADIKQEQAKLKDMRAELTYLNKQKSTPKIEADKKVLETAIDKSEARLNYLNNLNPKPRISVNDQASQPVRNLQSLIANLPSSKTITIHAITQTSTVRKNAQGGDYLVNKPTLFIAGEAGRERARFTPYGAGGSETASGKSTGTSRSAPLFENCQFIGSPPEEWAEFVQANAAEIMDMGFASQSEDDRARARGMI
jgi:hypothetical protein